MNSCVVYGNPNLQDEGSVCGSQRITLTEQQQIWQAFANTTTFCLDRTRSCAISQLDLSRLPPFLDLGRECVPGSPTCYRSTWSDHQHILLTTSNVRGRLISAQLYRSTDGGDRGVYRCRSFEDHRLELSKVTRPCSRGPKRTPSISLTTLGRKPRSSYTLLFDSTKSCMALLQTHGVAG
jgi:hypothetical protein